MDKMLSPFIFLIRTIFEIGYNVTGSYGISVLLLSFAISSLLLPIFIYIEKAKKRDDILKKSMQPLIDEIKQVYTGQERYYYLKTLNRQFGYSQFKALIPILSLLVQIPFFIAAYQYLDTLEVLKGVSFGPLSDLSQPDRLFGIVNVLPVLMTVINLLTAYFYTRNGNTSERKQMIVVAGVFLILLFNLPSGLVLYWTMNNVFSFFRLFVTNREVFKRTINEKKVPSHNIINIISKAKSRLIYTFVFFVVSGLLSQLNWALNHNFNDIFVRIAGVFVSSFTALLFFMLLIVAYRIDIKITWQNLKGSSIHIYRKFRHTFLALSVLLILFQINWALSHHFNDIFVRISGSIVLALVVVFIFALIVLTLNGNLNFIFLRQKINLLRFGKKYRYIFIILALSLTGFQFNWAIMHNFNDIILRVIISILSAWVFVYIVAFPTDWVRRRNITFPEIARQYLRQFSQHKTTFILLVIIVLATQINWAVKYSFDDFYLRVIIVFIGCIIVFPLINVLIYLSKKALTKLRELNLTRPFFAIGVFLSAYLFFAGKFYYTEENSTLLALSFTLLTVAQIISVNFYRNRKFIRPWLKVLPISLLSIQVAILTLSVIKPSFEITIFNINLAAENIRLGNIILGGLLYCISVMMFTQPGQTLQRKLIPRSYTLIVILSLLYLLGFVFFWNPLAVYASFPQSFEFPAIEILSSNAILFSIYFVCTLSIYLIVPKQVKHFLLIVFCIVVSLSFVHNSLIPIDLGNLQDMSFTKQYNLKQPVEAYIIEAIFILVLFFFFKKHLQKYHKNIIISLLLINLISFSSGVYQAIGTKTFFEKEKYVSEDIPLISFSKEKENVVVILADMFHGWYMDRIIKESPEILDKLDGFTWYPNTLSVSSITCSSLPPLLVGYNATIDKLNKQEGTLEEKITAITEKFYTKVKNKGFDFTSTKLIYSKIDKTKFNTFLPQWDDNWDAWNSDLNIGISVDNSLSLLWQNALLHSLPIAFKPIIYNNAEWLIRDTLVNENSKKAKHYNFVRLLPYISNVDNENPNFIFLYTYASHHTWDIIDNDGRLIRDVSPYENNKWTIEEFAKWVDWMKNNEVYDNTKIIIVSDHGPHWWHTKDNTIDMDIPLLNKDNSEVKADKIMTQFALLLVKDYNSTGKMNLDSRLMSNADLPAIAFDENNPIKIDVNNLSKRILPTTYVTWQTKMHYKEKLKIREQYEVKDNIFDLNNWTQIK